MARDRAPGACPRPGACLPQVAGTRRAATHQAVAQRPLCQARAVKLRRPPSVLLSKYFADHANRTAALSRRSSTARQLLLRLEPKAAGRLIHEVSTMPRGRAHRPLAGGARQPEPDDRGLARLHRRHAAPAERHLVDRQDGCGSRAHVRAWQAVRGAGGGTAPRPASGCQPRARQGRERPRGAALAAAMPAVGRWQAIPSSETIGECGRFRRRIRMPRSAISGVPADLPVRLHGDVAGPLRPRQNVRDQDRRPGCVSRCGDRQLVDHGRGARPGDRPRPAGHRREAATSADPGTAAGWSLCLYDPRTGDGSPTG